MSWRIQVEHKTTYHYAGEVISSYNEARISPMTTLTQLVTEASVSVLPATRVFRYIDYWGTVVHAFDIGIPHTELVVEGKSLVTTSEPEVRGSGLSWEEFGNPEIADEYSEFLAPTSIVDTNTVLERVATDLRASHTPGELAAAIGAWLRGEMSYVTGTTHVRTRATEAVAGGRGVCQDFAHATLALARACGVPARYCSGYLFPKETAEIHETVEGESHAWVELWDGAWRGYDPTSGSDIGQRHVLVARGRDYADVSPLKGVFSGGPTDRLRVSVRLTRLA